MRRSRAPSQRAAHQLLHPAAPPAKTPLQRNEPQREDPADSTPRPAVDRVYRVFWTKNTPKKTKVFSDGYLLFKPNNVAQLQDENDQPLGTVRNADRVFKSVAPGDQTVCLGRIVESDAEVPVDEYVSGRLFVPTAPAPPPAPPVAAVLPSKSLFPPFSPPNQVALRFCLLSARRRRHPSVLRKPQHALSGADGAPCRGVGRPF